MTLESPSFNAVNAGTMIRLPVSEWAHKITDASPPEQATGGGEAPVRADAGMYIERIILRGEISARTATDQTIWNPTIINGVSRTALSNAYEFRDLLRAAKTAWWDEAGSGNWHNDGAPARGDGLCRLRLGNKNSAGSVVAFYVYGYIVSVTFGPVLAAMKDSVTIPFTVEFAYASVESI